MTEIFTPQDLLAGQLAGLVPALPQTQYQAAAEGLIALGWRPPADMAATAAVLADHSFLHDEDGDGWNEPRSHEYRCLCRKVTYGEWIQRDPQNSGLSEFLEEGHYDATQMHNAHLAQVLLAAGGGVRSGDGLVRPPHT